MVLVSTSFLIVHARSHEKTYELLNDEGGFPRLVDLISSPKQHGHEGIHRLLMELLYEMSRIQKIKLGDLGMSTLDGHAEPDFRSRARWLTWEYWYSACRRRLCEAVVWDYRTGV